MTPFQNPKSFKKRLVLSGILVCFSLMVVVLNLIPPRPAQALVGLQPVAEVGIEVQISFWEKLWLQVQKATKTIADIAFKNALKTYLNKLAYDTAVYIATGAKGQKPLILTQPGTVLKDVADAAYGNYLDKLARDVWGKSLCEPLTPAIKIQIGIATQEIAEPKIEPGECPVSKILENVKASQEQKLVEVGKTFKYRASELGAFLFITSEAERKAREEAEIKKFVKELEGEFEPLRSAITGATKTPASVIESTMKGLLPQALEPYATYTGTAIADAIGVFTNTLASKLLDQYFKKGVIQPDVSIISGVGGGVSEGIAGARERFASLIQPDFSAGGPSDILNELASCPPDPGPNNCVIDDKFRTAIEQRMTVQEALDLGFLDRTKPFGYGTQGQIIDYRNGYPYRSLVVLRKNRVIPVGWELAAQYIKQFGGGYHNLQDLINNYTDCVDPDESLQEDPSWWSGDETVDQEHPFCKLIDPNWVLKAPEAYCKRLGYGEKIISEEWICDQDTNGEGGVDCSPEGGDVKRRYIQREQICVDEQSCIAENEDGSCRAYGYCVEEKPIWRFQGDQCPRYYNTCQTYVDRQGAPQSYLENTLDFNDCGADNAGCQWYCQDYDSDTGSWTCTIDSGNKSYFDRDIEECDSSSAGCHEYLRTTPGANLITNPSFELGDETSKTVSSGSDIFNYWPVWNNSGVDMTLTKETEALFGSYSLKIVAGGSQDGLNSYDATGVSTLPVNFYLSADKPYTASAYIKVISGQVSLWLGRGGSIEKSTDSLAIGSWERIAVSVTAAENLSLGGINQFGLYSKDGPAQFLVDGFGLEEGVVATEFKDYREDNQIFLNQEGQANTCETEEVGCEQYTPLAGGERIPGIITDPSMCSRVYYRNCDQCPQEMVGCKVYQLMPLTNNPPDPSFPERQGDPDVSLIAATGQTCSSTYVGCEEYTNLDVVAQGGEGKEYYTSIRQCLKPSPTDCSTYYTWVGSDVTGYQLKSYRLKNTGGDNTPPATTDGSGDCSAEFGVNPDCRQFYDIAGNPYYRYYSKTITCSEDCHPLRNTLDEQIYYSIPAESITCPASAAGCREFKGNAGYNVNNILEDNFEDGDYMGWEGNLEISLESVFVGGYSLKVNDPYWASTEVTNLVTQDKSYILYFWAKGPSDITARFQGTNASGPSPDDLVFPGTATLTADWNLFTLGPVLFDRAPGDVSEKLYIQGTSTFYIDNIILQEVTDSIYLIKDSYDLCEGYENCEAYQDRGENIHYLKSFTSLCSDDKVGCEYLIDTQNSTFPYEESFTGGGGTIPVPSDNVITLVNDSDYYCPAEDKGCTFLGSPIIDRAANTVTDYEDVFLKDDPDKYSSILCLESELFCEEYVIGDGEGYAYFKDPSNRTCEYKRPSGQTEYDWYQSGTSTPCDTVKPPPEGRPSGGDGGWVGICPADESGCTEYRDPEDPADDETIGSCDPTLADDDDLATADCQSYYYIDKTVDKTGCNGIVDRPRGCLLFYDTADPVGLIYNADESLDGASPSSDCSDTDCDSNVVLQVEKDRVCNQWLYCKTSWEIENQKGQKENVCFEIGTCDKLGEQGQCLYDVGPSPSNITVNVDPYSTVDSIKNMSGYVVAGIKWPVPEDEAQTIEGYYPFSAMPQVGLGGAGDEIVQNGDFEASESEASNWEARGSATITLFDGDPPVERPTLDENNVLEVVAADDSTINGARNDLGAGSILAGQEYSLSLKIKYLDAPEIDDEIIVGFGYNEDTTFQEIATFQPTPGWQRYVLAPVVSTNPAPNEKAYLVIAQTAASSGKHFAIDDVSLKPVLEIQTAEPEIVIEEKNVYAMAVIEGLDYTEIDENNNNHDPATALGEEDPAFPNSPEGTFVSLGQKNNPNSGDNWYLTVNMGPDLIADAPGPCISGGDESGCDVRVFERGPAPGDTYEVYGSPTLNIDDFKCIGSGEGFQEGKFDISGTGYEFIRYVKIVDISCANPGGDYTACDGIVYSYSDPCDSGCNSHCGAEIDAVKALASVSYVYDVKNYVARSCRAYPEVDALSCQYTDDDLVTHQGWPGYCLEKDPLNENYCLDWWPVDILAGESNIFGAPEPAGYQGRTPLYYCVEAQGNYGVYPNSNNYMARARDEESDGSECNKMLGYSCDEVGYPWLASCYNTSYPNCQYYVHDSGVLNVDIDSAYTDIPEYAIERIDFLVTEIESSNGWPPVGTKYIADRTNNWTVNYNSPIPNDPFTRDCASEVNFWGAQVLFDSNGYLRDQVKTRTCDGNSDDGGMLLEMYIYLREPCNKLVQVVDGSKNHAWAGRTAGAGYSVPTLNYTYLADYAPFGGIVGGEEDPSNWDSKAEDNTQPLYIEAADTNNNPDNITKPYQIRGGMAYACLENCSGRMCVGGNRDGEFCIDDSNCPSDIGNALCVGVGRCSDSNNACQSDNDCPEGEYCIGGTGSSKSYPDYPDYSWAFDQLKLIFAGPVDGRTLWTWNSDTQRYEEESNPTAIYYFDEYNDMGQCTDNTRPESPPDDYCGVTPDVSNIKVNKVGGTVEIGAGGPIILSFNTNVDREQLPLKTILIDWDDEELSQVQYNAAPKSDPDNPHIFNHIYTGPGTYKPQIRLIDNWDWCSGAGSDNRGDGGSITECDGWTVFGGTIVVE